MSRSAIISIIVGIFCAIFVGIVGDTDGSELKFWVATIILIIFITIMRSADKEEDR